MDAQALGAIPIAKPVWAIGENVKHGVFIEGDVESDGLTKARFVHQIVSMALQPEEQEKIRQDMMPWARLWFDWERWVFQWEEWAALDSSIVRAWVEFAHYRQAARGVHYDQFSFQREHAEGSVLNVGCNTDGAQLKRDFGAINVDICSADPTPASSFPST